MSYHAPDLTGEHPLHLIKDEIYDIFKLDQRIEFHTPVFKDSLKIQMIGTTGNVELKYGTDYVVEDIDIDVDTTSRVRVYDPSFNKVLIKSVLIKKYLTHGNFQITVSYNQLYPNRIRTATYNQDILEMTPELAVSMLEELAHLRLQVSRTKDISSVQSSDTGLLELDLTQTNPNNLVLKERHDIDVPNGIYLIRPVCHSFYNDPDTLKVRFITGSIRELERGKDYHVEGIDVQKTRFTLSKNPVYNYIVISTEMVGTVEIDYHAFGGEPTLVDYKGVLSQIKNMNEYLNGAKFLTESTLGNTATVTAITERLLQMEDKMRNLLNDRASYGDKTSGVSRLYKVTASDSDIHWWTIASLYKVDGSDEIITADRMHLRVSTLYSKMLFDVYLSINLNNPISDRFKVDVISGHPPRGYVPFIDYSGIDAIVHPQVRAIWNDSASTKSGVLIQIGLPLKQVLTESIGVEDLSGSECCFKLVPTKPEAFTPSDNAIDLPAKSVSGDPLFVWDKLNPNSKEESTLLPFKDGHLIWAGAHCMNRPGGWDHFEVPHFLDHSVDYTRVRKVRLELSERNSYTFPVDIDVMLNGTTLTGTVTVNYYKEPMDVVVTLDRNDVTKEIEVRLNYSVSGGATALDLMGIVLYT